jgi:hypothetical protein
MYNILSIGGANVFVMPYFYWPCLLKAKDIVFIFTIEYK